MSYFELSKFSYLQNMYLSFDLFLGCLQKSLDCKQFGFKMGKNDTTDYGKSLKHPRTKSKQVL